MDDSTYYWLKTVISVFNLQTALKKRNVIWMTPKVVVILSCIIGLFCVLIKTLKFRAGILLSDNFLLLVMFFVEAVENSDRKIMEFLPANDFCHIVSIWDMSSTPSYNVPKNFKISVKMSHLHVAMGTKKQPRRQIYCKMCGIHFSDRNNGTNHSILF